MPSQEILSASSGRPLTLGSSTEKSFPGDLLRMAEWLDQGQPFAFARFGDGEWKLLRDEPLDITQKGNGEFRYDPENATDRRAREQLIQSFHYRGKGYFIGIGCLCCWKRDRARQMRALANRPDGELTWANLWGNSNYPLVKSRMIRAFSRYEEVYLVCHRAGDPSRLPFRVTRTLPIGTNAWTVDLPIADQIEALVANGRRRGALFLFSAGPLANILVCRGHQANPENTYLDMGSVFDPWLFRRSRHRWLDWLPWLVEAPGVTRGYLKPGRKRRLTCTWWDETEESDTGDTVPEDLLPPAPPSRRSAAS